jgi:hypothetical protein
MVSGDAVYAPTADSITWRIITSEGTNISLKYLRDGKEGLAQAIPYRRPTEWRTEGLRQR